MNQDNKLIRSLLQNVRAGSNASFEQLYQIYSGRIFTLCLRLLGNVSLAEVMTKNIFISAREQISIIRNDVSFGSWIVGVAVFKSLEILRNGGNNFSTDENVKTKIDKKNYSFSDLENGLLTLPTKQRLVFVLNNLEKYSEEETADLLYIKLDEVKTLLKESQNKLNTLQNLIQISDASARVNEYQTNIIPNKEIWKDIYSEINNSHQNNNSTPIQNTTEPLDNIEINSSQIKKEKKFGIFSWKKK